MKDSNQIVSEPVAQNLIKLISNVCFSAFVFVVLIITAIAVTYQPPDPWLDSAPALIGLFTDTGNATFKTDTSVISTGEDLLPAGSAAAVSPAIAPGPTITEVVIEKAEESIANATPATCSTDSLVINCSDPRVLIAIEKFNLRAFKWIVFIEYQTPVNGSKPNECDVSWKFRNKKEKSWRKYRDFRRFKIGFSDDCSYKVVHVGNWHSGQNARPARVTRSNQGYNSQINDTIPTLGSSSFRRGKYLYYSRGGGDGCKGMNQYLWSFLCGLGEAMYLNRTFVMDMKICLPATYSSSNKNEQGKKDLRFYFDYEHLKETAPVVEEGEFLRDWKKWDRTHKSKVPFKKVRSHKTTPMQLRKDRTTILWRQFGPKDYWYQVCEGQAANYVNRPWHSIWKSKRLMNIVSGIGGRMDWDYDAVHVVRGDKAQDKKLWPHLDSDTSPDSILEKLRGMIQPWRNVYIATNEPFYSYFDKLRSQYKVHLLDDYNELWGNTSEWYNETTTLNNGRPVEFDGYMRVAVDTEVLYRAKTRVETFYNLTKDCKDGVNTC